MIVFVGAVRHPLNSNDYSVVEKLLLETLLSICNQTNKDFRVVVVCNQAPETNNPLINKFVEFVTVDFQPPSNIRGAVTGMGAIRKDRSTKYIVGFLAAQKFKPDYIMIFDTDDYISPDIAEYVNTSGKEKNGWYIEQGYIMDHQQNKRTWPVNNFNKICGTSLIINNDLLISPETQGTVEIETEKGNIIRVYLANTDFSSGLTISSTQDEILSKVDMVFMNYIIGSHKWTADYFKLEPLPFPGAVWNWNTGENHGAQRNL